MINHIKSSLIEASEGLSRLIENQETLNKIYKASQFQINSLLQSGKIYSCGNGGSMCDAIHFANRVQELHIKVLHIFIELIERALYPESYNQ